MMIFTSLFFFSRDLEGSHCSRASSPPLYPRPGRTGVRGGTELPRYFRSSAPAVEFRRLNPPPPRSTDVHFSIERILPVEIADD